MKASIKATGEIINVRKVITNIGNELYEPLRLEWSNVKFKASDLDFLPEKETAVLEGWVARDQSGYLVLHYKKPHRTYGNTKWYSAQSQKSLPRDSFPSVTWQSEPMKIKIRIEEIEE